MNEGMIRYSVIREKNPREIVLLRGSGCKWKKCTFCDYHLDSSPNQAENDVLNKQVLSQVTGEFGHLEVINSGSFCELSEETMQAIIDTCLRCSIRLIHFECHFLYRAQIPSLRERFAVHGIQVKVKQGVETFDFLLRENELHKGIRSADPLKIAENFDEVCLLFGLHEQTADGMRRDIETGLKFFERVCVNLMTPNSTSVRPDPQVVDAFMKEVYPLYAENDRVDILLQNTDFGVGGAGHAE